MNFVAETAPHSQRRLPAPYIHQGPQVRIGGAAREAEQDGGLNRLVIVVGTSVLAVLLTMTVPIAVLVDYPPFG